MEKEQQQMYNWYFKIIVTVLLVVAVFYMFQTYKTFQENIELIKSDALIYGMDAHDFVSCQCQDIDGKTWESIENGFLYTEFNSGLLGIENVPNLGELKEGKSGTG